MGKETAALLLENARQMPLEICLSDVELRQIVCGAANLTERLAGNWIPTGEDQSAATKRLERWKRLAADGDEAVFRRILASYGLPDIPGTRLLGLLGNVRCTAKAAPPPWAVLLQEITRSVSASFLTGENPRSFLPPRVTRAIPFAQLYSPIAALARTKVEAMAPCQNERMHAKAWQGLQRHLLGRISVVCSLALQPKFLAFKAVRQPGPAFAFFTNAPPAPVTNPTGSPFAAFVHEQGAEGLHRFFLEYPVAARLTAQVTLMWIDFIAEFLRRLEADAEAVSTRFRAGEPLGKLVAARAGLSDPHGAGRSVLILDFASGCRLLYKPRPLQIDAAFFDLLVPFNARLRLGLPPVPKTLVRAGYGWEGYVAHSPCPNLTEARRFYRRTGALLGLIHEMRGIDFHCENLIAAGGHPIPVDLEALCHPPLAEPVFTKGVDGHAFPPDSSILRTGMLPIHHRDEEHFPDHSALGAPVHQHSAMEGICWKYVNTARMEAFWGKSRYMCVTHRPRLHGRSLSARHYLAELINGYEKAARLLRSDGQPAREWRAKIADMHRMTTRVIHRPTLLYLALIRSSLQPHLLTAGVDRSIALQALPETSAGSAIRHAEITALEMLDVPSFSKEPMGADTTPAELSADEVVLDSEAAAIRRSLQGSSSRRRDAAAARSRQRLKMGPT